MKLRLAALAAASTCSLVIPSTAGAATWGEIASGTTADITAIEYQSAERFWFATGDGKIFRRVAGTFQQEASDPTTVFRDIEFQDGGAVGFAVGTNGAVWRSGDAGDNWVKLSLTGGRATQSNRCDLADEALGDADSIRFAGPARAWIVAGGTQIFRTVSGATAADVGSDAAGWQYVNDNGDDCKVTGDVDDLFPIGDTGAVYFIGKSFGGVFFTSNALDTTASKKPASAGNGFEQLRRVAGDPANPNRQWAVTPAGSGGSYYARTTDGWNSDQGWTLGNPGRRDLGQGTSVDFAGGSVLAAGLGGMILHSVDGATFFFDDAQGALATNDWLAVDAASANDAAVGGKLGKLIVTTNLATVPDIVKPTGAIAGPDTAQSGMPVTFTANLADDAGGSGINPASIAWSAPGLSNQAGASVTYTFPDAGSRTVKVTFADNAGNVGEATKTIDVTARPVTLPNPTFPTKAPIAGGAAKRRGKKIVLKVAGRLGLPAGVSAGQACSGTMSISVYKGKKRLAGRTARVRSNCKYAKTIKVKRSKVGKARRLKLKVAFKGNAFLAPLSSTYAVRVRR